MKIPKLPQMYIKIVIASLLRRKSRLLIALLSITIGTLIMSGLATIYYDIPRQLGKEFRSYGANFIILGQDNHKIIAGELATLKNILPKNKVVGLAPYRYETTRVNQKPLVLAGTDFAEAQKNSPFWYVEGEWLTNVDSSCSLNSEAKPASDNSKSQRAIIPVMIGKEVEKALNLKLDSVFQITGVRYGSKAPGSRLSDKTETYLKQSGGANFYHQKLQVKGIISTGGAEESLIFMNLPALDAILGSPTNIDVVEASIELDEKALTDLSSQINHQLPQLSARPVRRVTASQDLVLGKLKALVLLVTGVVLLLTMIAILTTMMAVVTERRSEIGLKKALGAADRAIMAEFWGEGIVLGIIGGTLGTTLGFYFAKIVSLSVFGRGISLNLWIFPLSLALALTITIVSCYWPVKQAVKIDPVLVLRGE